MKRIYVLALSKFIEKESYAAIFFYHNLNQQLPARYIYTPNWYRLKTERQKNNI